MMPRRVKLAVLVAILGHGLFVLTARYRLSYDAYTHMLFAQHYAENWFSLWETRWYTGFTVVSYPPLTHQLIALWIPFLGFDKAFAFVLWVVTSLYPVGIYAFSRIFTGKTSASHAAFASAILLPIYVTAHIFGQLPFLTSTLAALFGAASFDRYLRRGGLHNFSLSVGLLTTSIALHHATLMVQPFLIFAVMIHYVFLQRSHWTDVWFLTLKKLIVFGIGSVIASILVIFPFWQWGVAQSMQTPIDHLSRHNFFADPLAFAIFFFPLYGSFTLIIPFLFRKWHPRLLGLLISFVLLFLLGLGGTTPLPRLLFGDAWEWLTYDRFAFWACLTLSPFFGMLWITWQRRWKNRSLAKPVRIPFRRSFLSAGVFSFFMLTVLGAWLTPIAYPIQPKPIAMQPIVDFLNEADHSQWRYLTFGFGDQFAYLNLLTQATTIDGSYHTARTLPELRESGVGQIDTSYWAPNGMAAIKPIVQKSGEHSVRWGFVNPATLELKKFRWGVLHRSPFVPLLEELGWKKIKILDNGILVYENPNALPLVNIVATTFPPFASFAWGIFPMLALMGTLSLGMLRVYPQQTEWVIRRVYSFAISLLPLALCFWLYRTVGDFSHPRVYFTYDNALFFLSDGLVLIAVILWLSVKIADSSKQSMRTPRLHWSPYLFGIFFLSFLTFSLFWSRDWRTSLYIALHFWLVLLLILSLRDWHETWRVVMYGSCAALTIELVTGFAGFAMQSTSFLSSLNMEWPGSITALLPGAGVVQLADGIRILRAYGTLPHPNILGGFLLIFLLGPIGLMLLEKKPNYPALILLSLGLVLLVLSFSRSAWLGCLALIAFLLWKAKYFERRRFIVLITTVFFALSLNLFVYQDLVFTRLNARAIATEQISTVGRTWLNEQAIEIIRRHPFVGVGIGSFLLELANTAVAGAPIEPVHNVFLLIFAELGILGLLLFLGVCGYLLCKMIGTMTPRSILASAVLIGLGTMSLFDHYLWTLAPGRLLLGLALGLWAGQVAHEA